MVSPFSIHQQQLAMLSQQQSFLAAASAKSNGGSQTFPINVNQPSSNGIHVPIQNWGIVGHQVPGMMMPVADQQKYVQVDLIKCFYLSVFRLRPFLILLFFAFPDEKQLSFVSGWEFC